MEILKSFAGAIFDNMPNPVFIKDGNLHFVFVNKAYEKMFDVKAEDVLGKSVLELTYLPEEGRMFYQREDTEVLQSGATKHHIFEYLCEKKELHTCLYWSSGFAYKNGFRGVVGVIVDIDKQARMIQRLRVGLRRAASGKKKIAEKNKIDPLTKIYNRGTFDGALKKLAAAADEESSFACIMLDIDHFKRVNDTFGHVAGDVVLTQVAAVLKECSRKRDLACRYGGEEFVILLPGSGEEDATAIAERVRRTILTKVRTPDGQNITVSAGCSEYVVGEAATLVIQRADKALYEAKESGRNRVCAARP